MGMSGTFDPRQFRVNKREELEEQRKAAGDEIRKQ